MPWWRFWRWGLRPAPSRPDFTGSTVTATLYNPNLGTILGGPTTAVVGADAITFPDGSINGNTAFSINITGDQILYSPLTDVTYANSDFNGFIFDFAGAPDIIGVTLDGSSSFTPTGISFTNDSIILNLSNNTVTDTGLAALDVSFAPSGVPEPATWAMFLAGFGGVGFMLRRPLRKVIVPFA